MPNYRVWYRDNEEPLEFATAYRCSEAQIVDQVFAHEKIAPSAAASAGSGDSGAAAPSVQERIADYHLAPVRYTEDESEINIIQ